MVSVMRRVAAISAGPRSASPRGRRARSFWGFLGLSAMGGLVPAPARCGNHAACFPSPLVGEGGARSAPDEGSLSAETDPSPVRDASRRVHPLPPGGGGKTPRFPERQVDALPAHHGMLAVRQRRHAVKRQPRGAAPYRDIAVLQPV